MSEEQQQKEAPKEQTNEGKQQPKEGEKEQTPEDQAKQSKEEKQEPKGGDSLRDSIRNVIREELAAMKEEARPIPRRTNIEEEAELAVREAAARLQHDKEHEKLRTGEGEKEKETAAPKKLRRLTLVLWGGDD